jgi:hypothetical protein
MKYEVWKYEDEYTEHWFLMPVDHQYEAFLRYREAYEPNSELVWSFEADTFWEAQARYNEFMGYEPGDDASAV